MEWLEAQKQSSAVTKLCKYTSTYLQLVDEKKIKDQENMHVIFDLQDFEAGYPKQGVEQLSEVTE